ncbi:hypothetical protein SDC9_121593 [bioreactor metagenome]|uniref:Uncharacterized protein n=1 Tax=bioreactor metagenome TaxID=1076179 RepID=A0A645CCE9_9ZZZZ
MTPDTDVGTTATAVVPTDASLSRPTSPTSDGPESVRQRRGRLRHRLADLAQHLGEPRGGQVEGLATLDPLELDGAQLVALLLVIADHTGDLRKRRLDRQVAHRRDEVDVVLHRGSGTGEVAGLLDQDLLGADPLGELAGEPVARVDLVELDVAERVTRDLLAGLLQLLDDGLDPGTLGQEDGHVADAVHDLLEAGGFVVDAELVLGHVHRVHLPGLAAQPDLGQPGAGVEPVAVLAGGGGGQPPAVPAHHLVDDELTAHGVVLGDDVAGEDRAHLGGGLGAERLADRDHIVVDRLRQADDGELVVVVAQVGGQVGGGGVGVVATDGVQDLDAVGDQAVGRDLEGVLARLDQAALQQVLLVGELDPGVADRGAAVGVQQAGAVADGLGDGEVLTLQETLVPVLVRDDLAVGGDLRVALDEPADGGGQTRGEAAGRQQSYLARHVDTFRS